MTNPQDLSVVVTGAGSGIGRACADQLAERGYHVFAVGRRLELLDAFVQQSRASGASGTTVGADCSTTAGRNAVADAVRADGRPVAAVIHAAGDDLVASFASTTAEQLDYLLSINLIAPFMLTQTLLPHLADGAGIVFVGSIAATRGRARHAAYGATKAGLIGLTVNLAVELGPKVRVNCVSPGATKTALLRQFVKAANEGLSDDERDRLRVADAARIILGRVAEPADVARTCVHLAIDATAITGLDIAVDVGYSAS